MATLEQIEKAAKMLMFPPNSAEFARFDEELTSELGNRGLERLLDSPELERACQALERADKEAQKETFTNIVNSNAPVTVQADEEDWIPDPDLPGYAISAHLRVKAITGGPGRKVGRILRPSKEWAKTRDGDYYFRVRFQLTVNGASKKISINQIAINRYRLEGKQRYSK